MSYDVRVTSQELHKLNDLRNESYFSKAKKALPFALGAVYLASKYASQYMPGYQASQDTCTAYMPDRLSGTCSYITPQSGEMAFDAGIAATIAGGVYRAVTGFFKKGDAPPRPLDDPTSPPSPLTHSTHSASVTPLERELYGGNGQKVYESLRDVYRAKGSWDTLAKDNPSLIAASGIFQKLLREDTSKIAVPDLLPEIEPGAAAHFKTCTPAKVLVIALVNKVYAERKGQGRLSENDHAILKKTKTSFGV